MIRKIAIISLTILSCLCWVLLSGCSGREIEVDGWKLYTRDGRTTITSVNDSVVENGVLIVPSTLGDYNIAGFGGTPPFISMPSRFFFAPELAEHIIISDGVGLDMFFWRHLRDGISVELLTQTFENIDISWATWNATSVRNIIIPQSSLETFMLKFGDNQDIVSGLIVITEKSNLLVNE